MVCLISFMVTFNDWWSVLFHLIVYFIDWWFLLYLMVYFIEWWHKEKHQSIEYLVGLDLTVLNLFTSNLRIMRHLCERNVIWCILLFACIWIWIIKLKNWIYFFKISYKISFNLFFHFMLIYVNLLCEIHYIKLRYTNVAKSIVSTMNLERWTDSPHHIPN